MRITKVNIHLVNEGEQIAKLDSRVLATAQVRLDNKLYLNDIKICKTAERVCIEFVRNPYSVDPEHIEYSVVPVSMEARHWIEGIVLTEYIKKCQEMHNRYERKGGGIAIGHRE